MENINLIKKINLVLIFAFLAFLAVITADIAVIVIDESIIIPVKKEKRVAFLKKKSEKKKALIDYKDIYELNVFNAAISDENFFKKDRTEKVIPEGIEEVKEFEEQKTTPEINIEDYELYGTLTATPKEMSYATIYNKPKKKYEMYGLKEYNKYIDEVYEIVDITRTSVDIKTKDGTVTLSLTDKKESKSSRSARPVENASRRSRRASSRVPPKSVNQGITRVSDNRYIIDQRMYQDLTKDVSSLMALQKQVNFTPKHDKNNNPIGFQIRRITPGSIFQKIGLRRNDVVKSINGRVLKSMSIPEALGLLNELKNETNINVDLLRRNKDMMIGYEVR